MSRIKLLALSPLVLVVLVITALPAPASAGLFDPVAKPITMPTVPADGNQGSNAGAASAVTPANGTSANIGVGAVGEWAKQHYGKPKDYQGAIPDCAFSGTCREVNKLLELIIEQGKNIFGLIGIVALAAFVYGGFTMIFSFGSAEKTKKGRDILIAAVVGLVIAFSAYLLVNFLLDALGVDNPDFRGIK